MRAAALVLALLPATAFAQEESRSNWQFYLTPYLWVSGVSGTSKFPDHAVPTQEVDASFGDILSHLNSIPVMAAGEIRDGPFGVQADIIALSVAARFPIPGPYFSGGKARLDQIIGDISGLYRIIAEGPHTMDVGLGVRAFGLDTKVSVTPGLLPGVTVRPGTSWADPILSLRYAWRPPSPWSVTVYGDVGTGPDSPLTWQFLSTVNYRLTDSLSLRAGYRHLRIEFADGPLRQNNSVSGPILGATTAF